MADEDKPETGSDDDTPEKDEDPKPGKGDTTAMKAALRKANNEAAKYRKQVDDLEKRINDSESASKSDMEKLLAKFEAMEERATKAEREALVAQIADDHGLTRAQASRLRGSTRDELEADAAQMRDEFGIKPKAKADSNGEGSETETTEDGKTEAKPDGAKPSGKPKEKLQGGATPPGTDDAVDPAKLAKSILDSPW